MGKSREFFGNDMIFPYDSHGFQGISISQPHLTIPEGNFTDIAVGVVSIWEIYHQHVAIKNSGKHYDQP